MKIANIITFILVLIGGLNWLLVGALEINVVDLIFGAGSILSRIIYVAVGISALWLIFSSIYHRGLSFKDAE